MSLLQLIFDSTSGPVWRVSWIKSSTNKWDKYILDIANTVSTKSKDPNTQIGAVIIDPKSNAIISTGYNSFVRGLNDHKPERSERPEKYNWIEHAERNAIYNAARMGHKLEGSTMYLSGRHFTCHECAKAIVQSGIKTLFAPLPDYTSHYKDSFKVAERMYCECGLDVYGY
jgi:dCMP deaminase